MPEEVNTGIVVGVDGSEGSARAVRFAALEAERRGADLDLVHVVPDFGAMTPPGYLTPAHLERDVKALGATMLEGAAAAASELSPGVRCRQVLRSGHTVSTLLDAARDARMIVLGHETVPPLRRVVTAAVTMGVSARARQPVVSVPADWEPAAQVGPVVVGFKSSGQSHELLSSAFAEASVRHARLVIVHAWALPSVYDDRIVTRTHGEEWSRAATVALEALLADHRSKHPAVEVELKVVHDQAAHALLEESDGADLAVLIRRRHGYPPATHLGGTARALLSAATCPVMVLPAYRGGSDSAHRHADSAGAARP